MRAGATQVRVVCLEAREAMLADPEEIADGLAEGIEILAGVATEPGPVRAGRLAGVRLRPLRGFAFGPDGLRLDYADEPARDLTVDSVIIATGQRTDLPATFGVARRPNGRVLTGPDGRTDRARVFAAGDAVNGTSSVVGAIASARTVAAAVDRELGGDGDIEDHFYDRRAQPRARHDPRVRVDVPDDCATPAAVTTETSRCCAASCAATSPRPPTGPTRHTRRAGGEPVSCR